MEILSSNQSKISYKCLPYIIAIYSFFFVLPSLLLRKMVELPIVGIIPISILFTGIYFMLLDVITEVYGYYMARRALYASLVTYTLFVFIMELIAHIPSPASYHVPWSSVQDINAYQYLFTNLFPVWISVIVCALTANTLNIIVLSKWKILVRGKYFWMRSIITSLIAAIIFSVLSNFFAFGIFLHDTQFTYLVKLTIISIFAKLLTLLICAYPATLLCYFLKRKENINIYDQGVNYNPFSFFKK